MNKVWLPAMHPVIVALMAERLSVAHIMAQVWTLTNRRYVMRLKASMTAAHLTGVVVALQYSRLPRQIFGATSALCLAVVRALRYALTFHAAIDVRALSLTRPLNKGLAAYFASVFVGFTAALLGAVDAAADMRRRTSKGFTTGSAGNGFFLRLSDGVTSAGTVTLERIHIPVSVALFGDDFTADFAALQFVCHA